MNKLECSIQLAQKCLEKAQPKGLSIQEATDQLLECLELVYNKLEELEQKNIKTEEVEKNKPRDSNDNTIKYNKALSALDSDISESKREYEEGSRIDFADKNNEALILYLQENGKPITSLQAGKAYDVVNTQWMLEAYEEEDRGLGEKLEDQRFLANLHPNRLVPFIKDLSPSQTRKFLLIIEGSNKWSARIIHKCKSPEPKCKQGADPNGVCPLTDEPCKKP